MTSARDIFAIGVNSRSRDGFQMAAGWMRAGLARPGRRLKAPGEGNRGQHGLGYGDFTERAGAAVSKLRRLFVAGCGGQREAASRPSSVELLSGAALLSGMLANKGSRARR